MIADIIACFWFVMFKESSLKPNNYMKSNVFVNYPQWLVAVSRHGWDKVGNMSMTDQGALYPLNVTQKRLNSVVDNRSSQIEKALILANRVVKSNNLPVSYTLQLAVLIESNLWVNWRNKTVNERRYLYLNLWVGFSGSLWKQQRDSIKSYK